MDAATKTRLVSALRQHIDERTTQLEPAVMTTPSSRYSDPDHLAREVQVLFRRYPLVLGHVSALPQPGSFATHDLSGLPLVLMRQTDGSVRTFLNACRHRGARLLFEDAGQCKAVVCKYHAWSYRLDGTLLGIPAEVGFSDLDRSTQGLIEFPTEVRHGLVWTILTPGASIDVASYLGEALDADLADYGIDDARVARETVVREPINWKMIIDGFLESYHVQSLHRETVAPYYKSNLCISEVFGPHIRHVIARKTFDKVRDVLPEQVELLHHGAVVYILFPNTVLLSVADRESNHFEMWNSFPEPKCPGRSAAHVRLLVKRSDPQTPERDAFWERNWAVAMKTVLTEDLWINHGVQATSETGLVPEFSFGRNEPTLQQFHRLLDAALAANGGEKP